MSPLVVYCNSCNVDVEVATEYAESFRDTEGKFHDKVHCDVVEVGTN